MLNLNLIIFQSFCGISIEGGGVHLIKQNPSAGSRAACLECFALCNRSSGVYFFEEFSLALPGTFKFWLLDDFYDLCAGNCCHHIFTYEVGQRLLCVTNMKMYFIIRKLTWCYGFDIKHLLLCEQWKVMVKSLSKQFSCIFT